MARGRAYAGDVPGRSSFWAHLRYAAVLVPQAYTANVQGDGDAGIHLCLRRGLSVGRVLDTLILPRVNSDCIQIFLDEVASRHPNDRVVMVLDGAGWHKAESLKLPENVKLLPLPPYAPELNPAEHVWDDLREKAFGNRIFGSLDALEHHSWHWNATIHACIPSWHGHGVYIHF